MTSQVAAQLVTWIAVPYANSYWLHTNVRFLVGAVGLTFAQGVAALEVRGVKDRAIALGGAALAVQSVLQHHAELAREVRIVLAWANGAALIVLVATRVRDTLRRRWLWAGAAALVVLVPLADWWVRYRDRTRYASLASEYKLHSTSAGMSAPAWAWLDAYGGDGTVAVAGEPEAYFLYPAMGTRLVRRVVYVNVNARDSRRVSDYPNCNPRVDLSAAAWLANVEKQSVRWVLLSRRGAHYPVEDAWASEAADRFALRYQDPFNRLYERVAAAPPGAALR
jgi:hypothetical protein